MFFVNLLISTKIVGSGFLIYRIHRFTRAHRTWELCLVFILFTTLFVIALDGSVPSSVRQWLPIAFMALAIIMALEPELASFAAKIAKNLDPNAANRSHAVLTEIVRAARTLAATKTGALIAFERNDSLLKFGGTGIEINADIKKELLVTLFAKDTPTHDGGLLIRKGRVTHCGAVFPLSERKQIENGLGTRHRAAIGLTEKTDAVCLVVSEEEGTISIAEAGELIYAIPVREVERKLARLLSQKSRSRFYPLHYLRQFSTKLAQPNYIQLSKSLAERVFELSAVGFWSAAVSLGHLTATFPFTGSGDIASTLLHTPWTYIPLLSLALSLISFLQSQRVVASGVLNQIKIEKRLFFLPLYRKRLPAEDLDAIQLRRERVGPDVWSLLLLTKKRKSFLIDRSTAVQKLTDAANNLRNLLRIDLIS